MKREIENPYSVNYKLYKEIIKWSIIGIFIGSILPTSFFATDIVKNLSYGCFASTLVALLIETQSIKDKNAEANRIYDMIYGDLCFSIGEYLECWSRICKVGYPDKDFETESHTWYDWYRIARDEFQNCDENRQKQLLAFFTSQLLTSVENVNKELYKIEREKYLLMQSHAFNNKMGSIISDFKFEYDAAAFDLNRKIDSEEFWKNMEAINTDLKFYIDRWSDVDNFNEIEFKPYEFRRYNE